jgi:RNA polymerase sigma-70 factor (ECF subfamily)
MVDDDADFSNRLEHYRNALLLIAQARCSGLHPSVIEAEDIVQETLRHAHAKRQQFRGQSDLELRGWLRAILASLVAQSLRKAGHRVNMRSLESALERSSDRLERFLASNDPTPSQNARTAESKERLYACLNRLSEDQRRAVVLHHIEGKSVSEVGATLGRSSAAVASLLHRAVEAMRTHLANDVRG